MGVPPMLGWFRGFVRSKLGFALFVLLIISFGIFFRDPFQGFIGGGFVQVGNREIRPSDINRQVNSEIDRIRVEENKIISPREAAQQGITMQVYQEQVQRALFLEYADKIGVRASASAVTALFNRPGSRFLDALGRLNVEEIRVAAREQSMSVEQFQDYYRDTLTITYLVAALQAGLETPEILTKPLLTFFGEQRTISLARLTPTSIPEPKAPADAELQAWYDKNKTRFNQPERRRISVLSYSSEDFIDKAQAGITDAQVKSEYERKIADYSTPATREFSQFTGERAALQTFVDTVKQGAAIDDALKRVAGVTKVDLTVKPGDLKDKQFNDYIFGVPQGQLMGPVQVEKSWYVVQVNKIVPGVPTPLEQVSDQIRSSLAQSDASRLYNASSESFYDMAGGISLEEIGAQIGAPTMELPPVDRNAVVQSGAQSSLLAQFPEAVQSLFKISSGQMTDVIEGELEDPQTRVKRPTRAIFRVDEIVAPRTLTFEEAKKEVRSYYLAEKVQEAANKLAEDVVAATKAGKTFEQAAAASKMNVIGAVPLIRGMQPQIDPNIFDAAFKQQLGEVAVVKGQGGEPWVVKVDKAEPANEATMASLKSQIDRDLERSIFADISETFVKSLQREVQVKPNEKAVQDFFDRLTKDETQ